jgi:hypothetical protein
MLGKEINKINNTKDKEVKALNALKVQDTLTSDSFDKNDGNVDSADNTADNL